MNGFLLDENISFDAIAVIKKLGYKAEHIKKIDKTGIRNGEVYKIAVAKKLIIITRDSDFESIVNFDQYNLPGVIVFRLTDSTTKNIIQYIKKILTDYKKDLSTKHLIIVFDNKITIYPAK